MTEVRAFCLGGCNLRKPLYEHAVAASVAFAGPPFFTYTIGEMRQALAGYRGEVAFTRWQMRMCDLRPETAPTPDRAPWGDYDIALIEPNTSIEITLDGVHIGRRPVWQLVRDLRGLGPHAVKLVVRWFEKGICGLDEAARREAGAALVPLIPPEWPRAGVMRRVLRRAVSTRPPLTQPLADLVQSLAAPVGIVLFNWAYMPDGRALSWPAGFTEDVAAAAAALNLPLFDPADHLRRFGVAKALEKDFRHYTDAFQPVIAGPLARFAAKVAAGAAPTPRPIPNRVGARP